MTDLVQSNAVQIPEGFALVSVTYGGEEGDVRDFVPTTMSDEAIRSAVAEAIASSSVLGIHAQQADLRDFVVTRYQPNQDYPYSRIVVRPKVPFGVVIDELTIGQAREIAQIFCSRTEAGMGYTNVHPYPVGKSVLIRTVTLYYLGRLVEVHPQELVLTDASWLADTGRFGQALAEGTINEVEPFPDGRVVVGRGAVIDCSEWRHNLPRAVK